jgi:SAM-dependent methyltransferase
MSVSSDFDEDRYLAANPDVAEAVRSGAFASGRAHYEAYGKAEGRVGAAMSPAPAAVAPQETSSGTGLLGFEQREPSAQTAVDIFRGRWASDLSGVLGVSGTGTVPLFAGDERPLQAARVLGRDERLDGMDVLELGPLEAGHTYQLERLGARSIVGVEANSEAYLKCLVVKELCRLERSRFLLGDVVAYLESATGRFDLVFCSGILYHMPDPLRLIRGIARVTDRCFVWTHYYAADQHNLRHVARDSTLDGFTATCWSHAYGDKTRAFWGGNQATAAWLERDALFDAFRHFGLGQIETIRDDRTFVNGPNVTFTARRPG